MITNTLLLILLATSTYAQNCAPSASADQLTTGTYTINLQPYTTRLQCYNVTLDTYFTNNRPQVALGLAGVANFQSDASGLDYSLRHSLLNPTILSLILIVNNGSWGSATISYLVSSRPEFTLGNSLSNGNLLASCTRQQSYPLTFNLPTSQTLPSSTQ